MLGQHRERVGIGKSGCVGSDEFCYAVKVNATLSPSSLIRRVADYFFESAESVLDSSDASAVAQAFVAFDFGQSCAT